MSHLSLYREFRPTTFSEVAGQKHITDTLINQIRIGRVGHAYLFTGSRGVGKTTCARIFARAINCVSPKDGSPCYTCEVCLKLDNPSNLDITEIDAASNNGVDDARELRERVKYPPIHGKYKVFIIDEVHMLTGSAFNALLKTLEEPPPYVVFILATTEAYKLPATILSRVMRFDFRLLPTAQIEEIISDVYKKSGKDFETEAVKYIAMLGEGSARDALSIAERCLSISEGKLLYSDVLELLGAAGITEIKKLTAALLDGQIGGALETVDRLIKSGKSAGMIAKDILSFTRDLLVVKAAPAILDMPKKERDSLVAFTKDFSVENLATLIQIFSAIETELRFSVSVRTVIETACVRACKLAVHDLSAIEERIARLEKHGGTSAIAVSGSANSSSVTVRAANASLPSDINIIKPDIDNINKERPVQEGKDRPMPATSSFQNDRREPMVKQAELEGAELPSARSLWGRIITQLRTGASRSVYAILSEIGEIKLNGRTLKIVCGRDNYLAVSSDETMSELKKAIVALGYDNVSFEAELVDAESDMDKDIQKIKNMIGSTPFKVN